MPTKCVEGARPIEAALKSGKKKQFVSFLSLSLTWHEQREKTSQFQMPMALLLTIIIGSPSINQLMLGLEDLCVSCSQVLTRYESSVCVLLI